MFDVRLMKLMDESGFTAGRQKMVEVVELVKQDLLAVQTGRAKPALVESVKVEAYEGAWMEVKELASITAPDAHSIVIKPWDQGVLKNIAEAIRESDLGVSPVIDSDVVRINIPALTEERRQELVKMVKQKIEAGKAMLRQVRLEMKKEIDDQKGEEGVSEDDIHQQYAGLQDLLEEFNGQLDSLESNKEQELMSW